MELKIDKIQKSNILSFVAGFMQSMTLILAFVLWKYYIDFTTTQNLALGGMIIINEALTYILMRIASIIAKK